MKYLIGISITLAIATTAITVPIVMGQFDEGHTPICRCEPQIVEAAIQFLMAEQGLTVVPVPGQPVQDFTEFDFDTSSDVLHLFPTYLRNSPTLCRYTWSAEGEVIDRTGEHPKCDR